MMRTNRPPESFFVDVATRINPYTGNAEKTSHPMDPVPGRALCAVRNQVKDGRRGRDMMVSAVARDAVRILPNQPDAVRILADQKFYPVPDMGENWYRYSEVAPVVAEEMAVAEEHPVVEEVPPPPATEEIAPAPVEVPFPVAKRPYIKRRR